MVRDICNTNNQFLVSIDLSSHEAVNQLDSAKTEFSKSILDLDSVKIELSNNISVSRSSFSSFPVFLSVVNGYLLLSSHYILLLGHLQKIGHDLSVNKRFMVEYIKQQCPLGYDSFINEIQLLRTGEKVSIAQDESIYRSDCDFKGNGKLTADIENVVADYLGSLDINSSVFHISSGLDSSLLVLIAASIHGAKNIRTVTCKTLGGGASSELEVVKQLQKDIGFNLSVKDFENTDIFQAGAELIRNCIGYPVAHPSHLVEFLLDSSVRDNSNCIISGRGPDELLGGYGWHTAEYADPILYFKRINVSQEQELEQLFKFDIDNYKVSQLEKYIEAKKLNGKISLTSRLQIDCLTISQAWDVVHTGIEFGLGIKILKPFQDQELARGLFSLPDKLKVSGMNQKIFMRKIFEKLYPSYLINTPKQGMRLDIAPYLESQGTEVIEGLRTNDFVRKYMNEEAIQYFYNSTISGNKNYGWQLWSIYLLSLAHDLVVGKRV